MPFPFKICCMRNADEADMAIASGAHAIGLVAAMPNGPGPISDEEIRDIAEHVAVRHGDGVWTTLLTSRTDGAAIAEHVAQTRVNTVQIVDTPEPDAYRRIREANPDIRIMQVIHVEDEGAIEQARAFAESVDVILLDSGKPSAATRTLGGTGDVHDWSISRRIVEAVACPVFLAGGLNPANVGEAVRAVQPFGVDVCSGLRDQGAGYALLEDKVAAFVRALSM